jgi:hypothetical protein
MLSLLGARDRLAGYLHRAQLSPHAPQPVAGVASDHPEGLMPGTGRESAFVPGAQRLLMISMMRGRPIPTSGVGAA